MILNVVNNQWAISSFSGIAGAGEATFAARAIGYGLPGLRVDGNDFLAVYAATKWAAERARANLGATLIETVHLSRRRPFDERRSLALPPEGRRQGLAARRSHRAAEEAPDRHRRMVAKSSTPPPRRKRSKTVRAKPEAAPRPSARWAKIRPASKTMFEDVFKEMTWHQRRQRQEMGV